MDAVPKVLVTMADVNSGGLCLGLSDVCGSDPHI